MEYRILGKTGLSVSVISYGAAPLGSEYREIDEVEGIRSLHVALDLGVNFIDVSPYYGRTKAETILGKALVGVPRDKYYLATKVGRYDIAGFDFSAERVVASVDESLERLGVDYIDLIQCHDIEFGDLDLVVNETIPALRKVQEQGKVGFIGITGLPLKIFRYVMARIQVDTILSYCRYSLNDTALTDLIPSLQEQNLGVISASPLSMRLLTNRGAPDWHPASNDIKETCAKAAKYCRQEGVDISQLGMQFSLSHPDVHTTLMGTANPENVKKNIAWIEQPVDHELLAKVNSILAPIANKTWLSGRPENN